MSDPLRAPTGRDRHCGDQSCGTRTANNVRHGSQGEAGRDAIVDEKHGTPDEIERRRARMVQRGASLEVSALHGCESLEEAQAWLDNWDARWATPFAKQGILDGKLENGERVEGERVVVPGDLERSAIYTRSTSDVVELRMPPIGRRRADEHYAALLERWIRSLPTKHAALEPEGSAASGAR